jgi:hypothetical protein
LGDVTRIADRTFNGCTSLTSINLPDSLITIGYQGFQSAGLTSIYLASSVTTIGDYAFNGPKLTDFIIDSATIYSKATAASNGVCGGLMIRAKTLYILEDIDDESNTYIAANFTKSATQEVINNKRYNVYTKN